MKLTGFLEQKNIDVSRETILLKLMKLSLEWNEKINVTAIKNEEDFIEKNLIDSLTIAGVGVFDAAGTVLDMGTGGGFPGLPLAACFPEKKFLLVDSVDKKLKVVKSIADELGLRNVSVLHSRAEDMAKDKQYRENFDLVVSRAVANLPVLCEYCMPFVKVGGNFTAYKTEASSQEIADARFAIKTLGGASPETVPDGIEGSGHIFVIVNKIAKTPSQYPRKAGVPIKQPLK